MDQDPEPESFPAVKRPRTPLMPEDGVNLSLKLQTPHKSFSFGVHGDLAFSSQEKAKLASLKNITNPCSNGISSTLKNRSRRGYSFEGNGLNYTIGGREDSLFGDRFIPLRQGSSCMGNEIDIFDIDGPFESRKSKASVSSRLKSPSHKRARNLSLALSRHESVTGLHVSAIDGANSNGINVNSNTAGNNSVRPTSQGSRNSLSPSNNNSQTRQQQRYDSILRSELLGLDIEQALSRQNFNTFAEQHMATHARNAAHPSNDDNGIDNINPDANNTNIANEIEVNTVNNEFISFSQSAQAESLLLTPRRPLTRSSKRKKDIHSVADVVDSPGRTNIFKYRIGNSSKHSVRLLGGTERGIGSNSLDSRSFSGAGVSAVALGLGSLSASLNDALAHDLFNTKETKRKISKTPFKILDAPNLEDDFYLNLVDWSSQNTLAVGLGNSVYLWSASTSKVTLLCDISQQENDVANAQGANTNSLHERNRNITVTSVAWSMNGTHLSIGTSNGLIQIWDVRQSRKVRTMAGHSGRVGVIAWSNSSQPYLASGSRDRMIYRRDIRVPEPIVAKLQGHKQEVCGLKWSFDDTQLASGGNDNKLLIWNARSDAESPVVKFSDHIAAVKAIAWSPHQSGLLASGGGTADRCIKYWNTLSSQNLDSIDTGSQVCNLMWAKNVNEIVSTHGYSLNQVIVWKYPSMSKVTTLTGHTFRVLYLAMSPDGETVVTGAGDETLRFWNLFPGSKHSEGFRLSNSILLPTNTDIR